MFMHVIAFADRRSDSHTHTQVYSTLFTRLGISSTPGYLVFDVLVYVGQSAHPVVQDVPFIVES